MKKLTLLPLLLWAAWPLGAQTINTESHWSSPNGKHDTMSMTATDSIHAQMAFTLEGARYETLCTLVGGRWMVDIPLERHRRLMGDCTPMNDNTMLLSWAIVRDSDNPWEECGEELQHGAVVWQKEETTKQLSTMNQNPDNHEEK